MGSAFSVAKPGSEFTHVPTVIESTETTNGVISNSDQRLGYRPDIIAEAKRRFKDALEDAADDEEDAPSDIALTNALRAVQIMDEHCPQDVSSTVVLDSGIEATVRGSNVNYISVECQKDGDVLVMFNVRSYARYKGMDEAEREGFLKSLLETSPVLNLEISLGEVEPHEHVGHDVARSSEAKARTYSTIRERSMRKNIRIGDRRELSVNRVSEAERRDAIADLVDIIRQRRTPVNQQFQGWAMLWVEEDIARGIQSSRRPCTSYRPDAPKSVSRAHYSTGYIDCMTYPA